MKIRIVVLFLFHFLMPAMLMAQQPDTATTHAFFRKAMSQINPKHVNWVKSSAKTMKEKNLSEADVRNMASQYAIGMDEMPIEALISLVMMQCAKYQEENLRAILDEMKKTNERKKKIREATVAMKNARNNGLSRARFDSFYLALAKRPTKVKLGETKPVTTAEMDELLTKMNDERDSLNQLSEQQQLKMQLYMDRMTQADNAASNAMKKFSETTSQIIGNLK